MYELSYKHTSKLQLPIMIYKFFEVSFIFLTAIICICTYLLYVLQNTNIQMEICHSKTLMNYFAILVRSCENLNLLDFFFTIQIYFYYSIVKDSSADLGVNSKIVQIRPTVKVVSTKISKKIFCIFVNIFIFLRENKGLSFFIF